MLKTAYNCARSRAALEADEEKALEDALPAPDNVVALASRRLPPVEATQS
jgi:hypothetical protein